MSIDRNWTVMKAAGVSTNLLTIQYLPQNNKICISIAEIGTPVYQIEPTEVPTGLFFSLVGFKEQNKTDLQQVSICPNPCGVQTHILIEVLQSTMLSCSVGDISGKLLHNIG